MTHQSSRGWQGSGSGERRKTREWVTYLHNYPLTVIDSRTGIEAPISSNEIKHPDTLLVSMQNFLHASLLVCLFADCTLLV